MHHSFNDDLQLQVSAPYLISELLPSMQSCICDVKDLSTANMLKLNDNKTELMLVISKRSKHLHNLLQYLDLSISIAYFNHYW